MFRHLVTLARGRSADATQAVLDANAISLLRQQMRDAAQSVEKSRKAVAVVMAYAEREKKALSVLEAKIDDLETRARAALEKDREDLALEASGTIAELEAERDATVKAIDIYTKEIARLRHALTVSETQLSELKRGQRLAEANEKSLKMRGAFPTAQHSDLNDASATLKRLQDRHEQSEETAAAMVELLATSSAEQMSDRLADAGCGAPKRSSAEDVLKRLKSKSTK